MLVLSFPSSLVCSQAEWHSRSLFTPSLSSFHQVVSSGFASFNPESFHHSSACFALPRCLSPCHGLWNLTSLHAISVLQSNYSWQIVIFSFRGTHAHTHTHTHTQLKRLRSIKRFPSKLILSTLTLEQDTEPVSHFPDFASNINIFSRVRI